MQTRKNLRLQNYDYSSNGSYFLTICTHDKRHLFSHIRTVERTAQLELTAYGEIVLHYIKSLESRFPVIVDQYVIMPNHVHILVSIEGRAIRESPLQGRSIISKLTGYLKMNTSRDIHGIDPECKVWQRGFDDRIVRNQQQFANYWNYIHTNPLRWQNDCYYMED